MMEKNFFASIYLSKNQQAVKGLNQAVELELDALELALEYAGSGVDGIMIFDLSQTDDEHENAILTIKRIAASVNIPVYAAGNLKRMEDPKKVLYAGCKKAILNASKENFTSLLEEVSLKFGKDKIGVSIMGLDDLKNNLGEIESYASEVWVLDEKLWKSVGAISDIPVFIMFPSVMPDKMLAVLEQEYVLGLTGEIVNDNKKDIQALKTLCVEKGLAVKSQEERPAFESFKKDSAGLVPVIVQDVLTNQVLMMAYMNQEAYEMTLKTGKMTYYSRSRQELWIKGLTSGHYQYVKSLSIDCDQDTLLAKVTQVGAACHTGNKSCFFKPIIEEPDSDKKANLEVFEQVLGVIKDRKENPKEGSYTNYLFEKGVDKILKKLGEEATEIVISSKNPNPEEIKYEISDFLYHMMVLMVEKDINWDDITTELANR